MKLMTIAMVAAALALASCGKGSGPKEPAAPSADPAGDGGDPDAPAAEPGADRVCCESFGYGAGMEKCCESYAWTTAAECTIPPGFVGGGKNVVTDDRCQE
jgi:hypothetical protein